MIKLLTRLFVLFLFNPLCHGMYDLDSLKKVADSTELPNEERLSALDILGRYFAFVDPDSARSIATLQIELATKPGTENYVYVAKAYSVFGIAYYIQDALVESLESYFVSMQIYEKLGDKEPLNAVYQMIAIIYYRISEWDLCLQYNQRSLDYGLAERDSSCAFTSLGNIGLVYLEKDEYSTALAYFDSALAIAPVKRDSLEIASIYHNKAVVLNELGLTEEAGKYFEHAATIRLARNDHYGVLATWSEYGRFLAAQGETARSLEYCNKGLDFATQTGQLSSVLDCYKCLAENYERMGNIKLAYYYTKEYLDLSDSLDRSATKTEVVQRESFFRYNQEKLADSLNYIRNSELQKVEFERNIDREKSLKYITLVGLLGVVILLITIFQRMRIVRKKNLLIEQQKHELQEKNTEIMDSLSYAKRIQGAILPHPEFIEKNVPDNFVLYKPKDVVSGDFYWMQQVNDLVLFGAADCTGHGVPGALVSVVCHNALNRSVREYKLTEPGEVLTKCRELIIETFAQSEGEMKDGMDFALCVFDMTRKRISFSGANNPLWVVRKRNLTDAASIPADKTEESDEFILHELKGDKQPVGLYTNMRAFGQKTFQWSSGDQFYFFTDGYADQFGGNMEKKMKYSTLKRIILDNAGLAMSEQRNRLDCFFEEWKGRLDQTDDVCVIGVKF